MDKNFGMKWIFLLFIFLMGLLGLNASAYAEWEIVNPPTLSSNWELFTPSFVWAVGQDLENKTGVLLYYSNGSWISATLPNVSSDWELSGVDLISSSKGWAVGQDLQNKRGVLLYFINPSVLTAPTVSTTDISNISATTATGGGTVTSDGGAQVTARGVCWSTSASPAIGGSCTTDGTGTGAFTSSITGLTPNTAYDVRAYATNSAGTGYGSDVTFSTTSSVLTLPTVTTTAISNITDTTATGGGIITSDGGTQVTAGGVCWSISANPAIGGTCTSDDTSAGAFASSITGLTPNTAYHVRAYATNSAGTGYGSDVTFLTSASTLSLPAAINTAVPNVTATADTGGGLIWPSLSVPPPDVSSDWGLSAVNFISSDQGWAVGQDLQNQRGVLLYFSDDTWTSVIPPGVSSNWGLSSIHLISSGQGWAVGQDLENKKGVLLHFSGGSRTSVSPPDVSSDWGLSAVHFISSDQGWAVGQDLQNKRGVLLYFSGGSWTSVTPPDVSSDWGLSAVDFISSDQGWAVGQDFQNKRGVLLYFSGGSWTSVTPPDVSSDWGLSGIHLIAPSVGWAVGYTSDGSNVKGVLLKYTLPQISVSPVSINYNSVEIGASLDETIVVRNTGTGNLIIGVITSPSLPFSIKTDSCSGKVLAYLQACEVTYTFLPDSAGDFTDTSNIPSNGSNQNSVPVTLIGTGVAGTSNYIHLLSPLNGQTIAASTYSNPPPFQWDFSGAFRSIEVQFSLQNDFSLIPTKVKGNPNVNQLIINSNVWKKLLLLPGASGGTVYWRVIAKKQDKTIVESDVFSFVVPGPGPVSNPEISHTSKTTLPPPTLSWDTNDNATFTAWFGNDSDFKNPGMAKMPISFNIKNSTGIEGTFEKELTSSQWHSIRQLGGNVTGATLYWYIESSDILRRQTSTAVMSFLLTD